MLGNVGSERHHTSGDESKNTKNISEKQENKTYISEMSSQRV